MRRLLLAASPLLAALTPTPALASPSEWLSLLDTDDPGAGVWVYIHGLVNGSMTGSLMASGGATTTICNAHDPSADVVATQQILSAYVVMADIVDNPSATLEIVVPLAFAWAYPCGIAI